MSYYDLSQPYSIGDWNSLIRAVNDKLQNPPGGDGTCQPIDSIEEVTDPHIWSVSDVEEVRNKLIETCPDIIFSEPLEIRKPGIIDEIETALDETWCDCCTEEFKHDEDGTMIQFANYKYTIYHGCEDGETQPPDIWSGSLEGLQVAKSGLVGRSMLIRYDPEELWGGRIGRGISINCDGTLGRSISFKIKGSHGRTIWCPPQGSPNWPSCCGNWIWREMLDFNIANAETVENLQVNFEIYTKRANCHDCE